MIEITEQDIHLYIINKSLLDDIIVNEIEKRLKVDNTYLSRINELKEFYQIYNKVAKTNLDYTFLLEPMNKGKMNERLKLAAQQKNRTEDKLKYVNTFVSAENLIITRLLYNEVQKEYELYVLCEDDSSLVSYAIVEFENNLTKFITDQNGFIRIKGSTINYRGRLKITVPIARFEINPNLIPTEEKTESFISPKNENGSKIKLTRAKDKIICNLEFLGDSKFSIQESLFDNLIAYIIRSGNLSNPEMLVIDSFLFQFSYTGNEEILILITDG